jgi:acyl transferase domain-containing protein/acyl carrier protein
VVSISTERSGDSAEVVRQLDRARLMIADLRGKLAELQSAANPPIAIIGMACRFPGEAADCDGFQSMIEAGRSAVREIPPERARHLAPESLKPAALLDDIATFDAGFFDISPREAAQMDPQQRLFLEIAWRALEDGGQTRQGLAGSSTAVFVGAHNHNGGYFELAAAAPGQLNEYTGLGGAQDVIAGRLAFFLDLRGPAAAVNTACSSSLMAVHLACQSLWTRDCRLAVAGGVNLVFGQAQSRMAGLGGMLAPDGRCKTFDARANGYGRGEGCGVVVLKRLADAQADRDRILAVIRGSAVNQDGRSNGITAPNGLAQKALMRRALARAGMPAARVGYIETHGTGTALGDPIEVEALAEIYGGLSTEVPRCSLGSAKANVNHLEAAAGIAGLIALRSRTIPPLAGFERLNPHISLDGVRFVIPTDAEPWVSQTPRVAAVSSFGWSGVNAHVVVEEAPEQRPVDTARPTLVLVSTPDAETLAAHAFAIAGALDILPDEALESFAWTAAARRTRHEHCLAVVGATRAELAATLRRRAADTPRRTSGSIGFLVGDAKPAVALVSDLMTETGFREALGGGDSSPESCNPTAFAVGVAALLSQWSVQPAAVVGWGTGAAAARRLGGTAPADTERAAIDRLRDAGAGFIVRLDTLAFGTPADGLGVPVGSARLRLMHVLAGLIGASEASPAWDRVFAGTAQVISLPAMPFRRRRHWLADPPTSAAQAEPIRDRAPVAAPPEWFFDVRWRLAEVRPGATTRRELNCLIFGAQDGDGGRLAAALRGMGVMALLDSADPPELAPLLQPGHAPWAVIDLRACDTQPGSIAVACLRHAVRAAALWRRLGATVPSWDDAPGREAGEGDVRLWIVTRGAQPVWVGETPNLAGAALWGLGRSFGLAHPERWGGLIDLDPAAPMDAARIWHEIACGSDEREIAMRGDVRCVCRLERTAPLPSAAWRPDPAGTYLVTGAFGGVGPFLAEWLAEHGATSLVLAGRSLGDGSDGHPSTALARRLEAMGVAVRLESVDLGEEGEVAALLQRARSTGSSLRGIFNVAAAAHGEVGEAGEFDLAAAFRPKVDGSLHLDRLSRELALDTFVLFSSAAGVLGERRRSHYAAANSFMDALAADRRARGLPGLSIAWGLWGGRDEASPEVRFFRRIGLAPMAPNLALAALGQLLSLQAEGRAGQPVVAALEGNRLSEALELRGRARFLSTLAPEGTIPQSAESWAMVRRLQVTPPSLRRGMLSDLVADTLRGVLELAPEDSLDPARGFFDLGMDSLTTLRLKAGIEHLFGIALSSTVTLEYPTVTALADHIGMIVLGAAAQPQDRTVPRRPTERAGDDPVMPQRAIDEMNDEEVADALAAELSTLDLEYLG